MNDTLKDVYHLIGKDSRWFLYCTRLADLYPKKIDATTLGVIGYYCKQIDSIHWQEPKWLRGHDVVGFFKPLIKVNESMLYIKFLKIFEDCKHHSYQDIYDEFLLPHGKPYGNDKDTFMILVKKNLIEEDGKGLKGTKLYKITDFGKEILRIASVNNRVHRVLKHFTKFSDDAVWADIISTALTSEDYVSDDDPKIVNIMLDEILCPGSNMQQIGSHYFWCKQLVKCMKKSKEFYELLSSPEVVDHISKMAKEIPGFVQLDQMLKKTAKKIAKNVA